MLRKNLNYKLLKYFLRFPIKNQIHYFLDNKIYRLKEDTDYRYIVLSSKGNHIYDRYMFSTLHIYSNEDVCDKKDNEYVFNLFLLHRLFIYYDKKC